MEEAFAAFGVTPEYERSAEPYLHPGRQAAAKLDGEAVAVFGELHPDTAQRYGLGVRAYVAEVHLEKLYAVRQPVTYYQPLPRFPAVERDLALLCDEEMPVAEIEKTIRDHAGRYLESVTLFDVYQGAQIEAGKKSVAYALSFRSPQGTLTDAEIDGALQKIFKNLNEKGCILRS